MRKILTAFLTLVLLLFAVTPVLGAPKVQCEGAILIDAKTGQILYSKNQDKVLYPASITKIMTIYLGTQDESLLDKKFSVSREGIDAVPRDTSNIALDYGEEITLRDALYGAMLMSANDACNLIAEAVSGSNEKFVELMNSTAKTFGARNTSFANANGLTDVNHYTTAYDFAMITKEALKSQAFKKVFCSMDYTIPPTNKNDEQRNFVAQHRMMHQSKYNHLGVKGGKNGFTADAMYTLVTYAEKDGKELICVVLKSPSFNDVYKDTETLLLHGYNDFSQGRITADDVEPFVEGLTTYTATGETSFLLNNEYKEEDVITTFADGCFTVKTPDGTVLGILETVSDTRMSVWQMIWLIIKIIFFIIVGLIVALYALLIIASNKGRKKRKKNGTQH